MRNSLLVPWRGTKIDPATSQRLVRVISSAAVCGLSISFIVGEAVDYHAQKIPHWRPDPVVLPLGYLPAAPAVANLRSASFSEMKESLIAANHMATPSVAAASKAGDTVTNVFAAPALAQAAGASRINSNNELKAVFKAKLKPEKELEAPEVEKILQSIHSATAKLSERDQAPRSVAAVSGSILVKSLPERGDSASVAREVSIPVGRPPETIPETPVDPGPKATEEVVLATGVIEAEWTIRGRLSAAPAGQTGHFEIGLFAKIDQDGIPVGYPVAQKILPAGVTEFSLTVPKHIDKGYLYGEFVATKTGKRSWIAPPVNPWTREDRQFAELRMQKEDKIVSVSAAAEDQKAWRIKGSVTTMFTRDGQQIPQSDVVVKVRGRKDSARTDASGAFSLEVPKMKGILHLEFLKAGYHPMLVAVPAGADQFVKVELASREAIDQIAQRLGTRQVASKAVFIGKATRPDGSAIKGISLRMSQKADGPYYFAEEGFPASQLKATSTDGRFLFLNVEPGTGFVETFQNGEAIAPFLLSTVEGGEMVAKNIVPEVGSLDGRLFNPVSTRGKLLPVAGARIRVEGSADAYSTDSYGAFSLGPLKWIRGERISLEFSAEKFNNHRYLLVPNDQKGPLNLFAFPAVYLGRLAKSMDVDLDSYSGIVLGKVSGSSVRVDALADHSVVNSARDFYFDSKGKLRGSHTMTDPGYGTYVIFNVPKGRTLLQGNDAHGMLRYSEAVISSPATISIIMD